MNLTILLAAMLIAVALLFVLFPRAIKPAALGLFGAIALSLAGCANTSTITETTYAADGTTVASQKITETKESVIVLFTKAALDGNNIAIKKGGWLANIGVNAETNSYGIQAGSVDTSVIVAKDNSNGVAFTTGLSGPWQAQKYSLAVTKEGITAEGSGDTDITSTNINADSTTKAAE